MIDPLALPLEDFIDELPTPARRVCPVNGCTMTMGPLGAIYRGIYDGVLHWTCGECGGNWHRWPPGHPLRAKAEMILDV